MPVPKAQRALPVTPADFTAPFESNFTRFGYKGLNINDAIDAVEPNELTRMLNVTHRFDGLITARAGQTALTTATGANNHSIRRLNTDTDYTRIYGIDDGLYYGPSNSRTLAASGFSGNPLTMVPYHPPLSQDSWMYVADSAKNVKIRQDGLTLPIGLPAPGSAATTALATPNRTVIASFTGDTAASAWTGNPGYTYDTTPTPITGTEILEITDDEGEPAVHFGALQDTLTLAGYYAFYGCPTTVDLSQVNGIPATDDDYIHVRVNFSHVEYIKEFRIYLVCNDTFSPSSLPGVSGSGGVNSDAYVKAFSANDFAAFVQANLTQYDASELARIRELRNTALKLASSGITKGVGKKLLAQTDAALNTTIANQDQARTITLASNAASDSWQNYGVVSIPLRRGDWQRIGTTAGRDWSTITGIITYIQTGPNGKNPTGTVAVRISQLYMQGGSGPDSGEPEDSPFDYRYTNYDPRTGAESNPSPEQAESAALDSLRTTINVDPAAYGDGNIRQRIYRRGGTLPTDWYFVGTNDSDGGVFADTISDTTAAASATLDDDNYQPVPTVDANGTTVLGQPVSAFWGPLQDLLFACGDPYNPGSVYFCKPGNPESWPAENVTEVCSPSEPLQTGCLYGGQAFAFSQQRAFVLYPNFSGDAVTVTSTVTQCQRGPVTPWALAVGMGGMYFVASDGIYSTVGGPEEWLSPDIDPIFNGKTKNGYAPVDFTASTKLRLWIYQNELWFQYQDTNGDTQIMIYSIPFKFWRAFRFGRETSVGTLDEGNDESVLLLGGATTGKTYTFEGTSDDGLEIACNLRTGALDFSRPRLEKRLGDQYIDLNSKGLDLTLVNYLNFENIANAAATINSGTDRQRVVLDGFGTIPQRVVNIATDVSWSSAAVAPEIYQLGTTIILEPDVTLNRVTQWDDLQQPDAFYVMGVTLDYDTGGQDRQILIELDNNGTISTIATLTLNADGRHKFSYSWPGQRGQKVRIRPIGEDCEQWQLFRADWNFQAEPPAIATWDSYFENGWDQYYTGLDLYADTFGLNKTVEVYVDGVLVKTATVNSNGRLVTHITLPWGRGHVFRFVATDANPGVLYDYRWHLEAEPSEQTNWNQNFTVAGALNDKYLKGVIFECDTFGEDKTVTVECNGVVVETLTVNANGRQVVNKSFPQHLGRVFRIYPTDDNPGRLYSVQWLFDGEPFALDRWETQEGTNGFDSWSYNLYGHVTLKSTAEVTLTVTAYNQSGTATAKIYTIPSSAGLKIKNFVPFEAVKGVLHKYVLTSAVPFTLYREETTIYCREWGTDRTATIHPFGNDDQDPTRGMTNAALAAARSGGTADA